MSDWHPKPLRPADPNPLFEMADDAVVIKGDHPMVHQRRMDGTPITRGGRTSVRPPGPELHLRGLKPAEASETVEKSENTLDPTAVVKAYLEG